MGKNIPLELHHINMNHYDNRIENLQILCANCHAIAHDYSNSKNKPMSEINYDLLNGIEYNSKSKEQLISRHGAKRIKEKTKHVCVLCGKPLKQSRQKFCSLACARKASENFSPSSTELLKKIKELKSFSKVGKFYGVSDNSVKKRCKREGIYEDIKGYIISRNQKQINTTMDKIR